LNIRKTGESNNSSLMSYNINTSTCQKVSKSVKKLTKQVRFTISKPRRLHEIRTIAIDDLGVCHSVSQSVCHEALLCKSGWTDWWPTAGVIRCGLRQIFWPLVYIHKVERINIPNVLICLLRVSSPTVIGLYCTTSTANFEDNIGLLADLINRIYEYADKIMLTEKCIPITNSPTILTLNIRQ